MTTQIFHRLASVDRVPDWHAATLLIARMMLNADRNRDAS